jgi:hypothetical protein
MPNKPRENNRHRMVRVEDDLWDAAAEACARLGKTRSDVMRDALAAVVEAHNEWKSHEYGTVARGDGRRYAATRSAGAVFARRPGSDTTQYPVNRETAASFLPGTVERS